MVKRKNWLMLACLVAVALVLASCAPAAPAAPTEGQTITGQVTQKEQPETAPAAPAEEEEGEEAPAVTGPQYGGTLTIARGLEPMSWNSRDINWQHNDVAGPYAETLLVGDLQKGPRGTNEWSFHAQAFVPNHIMTGALAESWEITDPLTLTFHVRRGVFWQAKTGIMDARELTADDLVYHFTGQLQAPKEYLLKPFVDHFSAPDKYTFVAHLKQYHANWPYRLAWGYFITVSTPPELEQNGDPNDWRDVCGTGPFMLTDYVPASSVTYTKNPNYWGTTIIDGKEYKLPFVDKLVRPIISDATTRLAALRTGKVDLDYAVEWKFKDSLAQTNPELKRWRWLDSSPESLALRLDRPPTDDKRVRYALSMALDREAMRQALFNGEAEILEFPFPSFWGEQYYTPLEKLPAETREQFEYNPDKAKQLLAEAGYPNGFKLELVYSATGTLQGDIAAMVADFWKKIGVETELRPLEYASYYSAMMARTYENTYLLSTDPGTPLAIMRKLGETGQRWNPAIFSDPWFDETLAKALLEMDDAKLAAMLKELNVYLLDSCAYIQLPTAYNYEYAWPWLKNWYGEVFAGAYNSAPIQARMWIDQELKKQMGY